MQTRRVGVVSGTSPMSARTWWHSHERCMGSSVRCSINSAHNTTSNEASGSPGYGKRWRPASKRSTSRWNKGCPAMANWRRSGCDPGAAASYAPRTSWYPNYPNTPLQDRRSVDIGAEFKRAAVAVARQRHQRKRANRGRGRALADRAKRVRPRLLPAARYPHARWCGHCALQGAGRSASASRIPSWQTRRVR